MIIVPLVIGAIAVVITLCYASYLDIIDRKVPFITWVPLLLIGIPVAGLALLSLNNGYVLLAGYVGITSAILLLAYFNNREISTPKQLVWPLLIIILQVGTGSYFLSTGVMNLFLMSVAATLIFACATLLEFRGKENFFTDTWPIFYFLVTSFSWFYYALAVTSQVSYAYLGMIGIFCLIFYLFAFFNLFGGADAWALIFITLTIPLFPFTPLAGYPPVAFFPFTVLVNAVIFNLVAPVALFIMNFYRGNRAPLLYLFLGYPVDGDKVQNSFGFIIEDIRVTDGAVERRFLKLGEALGSLVKGGKRIYTKDLRLHPEQYSHEISLYKRAGKVWISYGVPFIVPITAGVIFGLFIGDILTISLSFFGGI
ncbi:MAG: A24 family peptidase C-terminal domain-containing protein [Methanomicrobiales archaeon]